MISTEVAKAKNQTCESSDPSVKLLGLGACTKSMWELLVLFGENKINDFRSASEKAKIKGGDEGYIMLLGLARIEGKQAAFEDIAVDYAVQFGQSPPSWFEGHTEHKGGMNEFTELKIESFAVDYIIETTVKMENPRPLRMDISMVTKLDASGIDLFNESLAERLLRGDKTKLVNGSKIIDGLMAKLRAREGKPIVALWSFCFSYFRLNNLEHQFDAAAQAFVEFGGEMPVWCNLADKEDQDAGNVQFDGLTAPASLAEMDVNLASGFLVSARGIKAIDDKRVTICMAGLVRGSIYHAIGFIDFLKIFKSRGIAVLLINVNEVFNAIFRAVLIDQLVDEISIAGVS